MKLHNKKTGEIKKAYSVAIFENALGDGLAEYHTIEELKEDWEDYTQAEPLIKDESNPDRAEKARKTLKLWADTNGFKKVSYHVDTYVSVFFNECNPDECATQIEFGWVMQGLKPGTYTITELCGEEEE